MPQATRSKQVTEIPSNVVDAAQPAEATEPAPSPESAPAVRGPSGRLTVFGKPVHRLFLDLGKDYTIPIPPRSVQLNWGSCIESQLDFKDEEKQGFYTRPTSMVGACARVDEQGLWLSWPDCGIKCLIKLTLGASLAWE